MTGVLPYRRHLAEHPTLRSAVAGVNAVVVGILGAALYDPLCTTGIVRPIDAAIALAACAALVLLRVSPLAAVAGTTLIEVALG